VVATQGAVPPVAESMAVLGCVVVGAVGWEIDCGDVVCGVVRPAWCVEPLQAAAASASAASAAPAPRLIGVGIA
jgi:hypothetical protein